MSLWSIVSCKTLEEYIIFWIEDKSSYKNDIPSRRIACGSYSINEEEEDNDDDDDDDNDVTVTLSLGFSLILDSDSASFFYISFTDDDMLRSRI